MTDPTPPSPEDVLAMLMPEDRAQRTAQQIKQIVDDQLAVLAVVTEQLASAAWREDNHALPADHRKPWEQAGTPERAPYLSAAMAHAAQLCTLGLLAGRLPDPEGATPRDGDGTLLLGYVPAALYGDEWRIPDPGQITPSYDSAAVQAHMAEGFNRDGTWSWGPADDIAVVSVQRILPETWKETTK